MDDYDDIDLEPVFEIELWTAPSGLLCAATVFRGEVCEVLVHDPEAPR